MDTFLYKKFYPWTFFNQIPLQFYQIFLTWAGAAIRPTAIPHTILPTSMAIWEVDSAIIPQPLNNGIMENRRVLFRPYASIIPADTNEPIGVAKECIDAMWEEKVKSNAMSWKNIKTSLKKCEKGKKTVIKLTLDNLLEPKIQFLGSSFSSNKATFNALVFTNIEIFRGLFTWKTQSGKFNKRRKNFKFC